jgi:hypothetical protein
VRIYFWTPLTVIYTLELVLQCVRKFSKAIFVNIVIYRQHGKILGLCGTPKYFSIVLKNFKQVNMVIEKLFRGCAFKKKKKLKWDTLLYM